MPLSRSKKRDASTTSGEISSTSARRTAPGASAEPTVTPLPSPMTQISLRAAVQQQRQQAEQPLRQHVAAVRRVHLAVDRQRRVPVSRLTLTVPAAPSL